MRRTAATGFEPHRKLARAFERRTGLRLTAEEVRRLVLADSAIETVVRDIIDGEWDAPDEGAS